MKNDLKQALENLPQELLALPRFFKVKANKVPITNGWSNPKNQKLYTEVEGYKGFDTAGHGVSADYLFLDYDHIFINGEFVNDTAKLHFNRTLELLQTYCELSASKSGAHFIARPTADKFGKVSSGSKGKIYFTDDKSSFLEIFYGTGGRYCLFTGDVYRCEPNAPIAHGEPVDALFQELLDTIAANAEKPARAKRNTKSDASTGTKAQSAPAELIYQSPDNSEFDAWRVAKMLTFIPLKDLSDTEWLSAITALKSLGYSYAEVDRLNQGGKHYNEQENRQRWDSLDVWSKDDAIGTLYNLAVAYGYDAEDATREWGKLHPEIQTKVIRKPQYSEDGEKKGLVWTQDLIKSCPVNLLLPYNFIIEEQKMTKVILPKKSGGEPKYFCIARTPIIPTKIFRDPQKRKYTYEIAILNRGVWQTTEIDGKSLVDAKAISNLNDNGALILEPKEICRFLTDIISLNPKLKEVKAYEQTGWVDDEFKNFAYIGNDDCIIRRAGFDFDRELATRGDAEEWKKKFIEVTEKGGAIAHVYIGTALAAILARPLNVMNLQAHLYGTSGSAKTTLQKFTASIFGNPRKLKRSFGATNKNRQLVAAAFCDLPTFFDELETVQNKAAEETLANDVYNFADGKGNQANKRDGTARETFEFGGARLTTGERPILKQNDMRGAYKRLLQFRINDKIFDDEFATDLWIFSELNFGHFGYQWIQFATAHMAEIQAKYQHFAKSDPTTQNYEPTHLKMLAAALVAFEFFKVMLGVTDTFDSVSLIRDRRYLIDYQLPTLDQMDDTTRAIEFLKSFVAGNDKAFAHEVNKPEFDNEFSQSTYECLGKKFKNGEVALLPHSFTEILEKRGGFASADKLRNDFYNKGFLRHKTGTMTYPTWFNGKTVKMIRFNAGVLSTPETEKEAASAQAD